MRLTQETYEQKNEVMRLTREISDQKKLLLAMQKEPLLSQAEDEWRFEYEDPPGWDDVLGFIDD